MFPYQSIKQELSWELKCQLHFFTIYFAERKLFWMRKLWGGKNFFLFQTSICRSLSGQKPSHHQKNIISDWICCVYQVWTNFVWKKVFFNFSKLRNKTFGATKKLSKGLRQRFVFLWKKFVSKWCLHFTSRLNIR